MKVSKFIKKGTIPYQLHITLSKEDIEKTKKIVQRGKYVTLADFIRTKIREERVD
jgi:Arc/MetJ-type ribon-helix-helix transcriptional regulator